MGDVDEGGTDLGLKLFQLHLHLFPQLQVQGTQRFVQQQHGRLQHQTAGNGDALFLSAGKLIYFFVFEAGQDRPVRG